MYDAIVVGAGPGGSVAAAVLAKQGIKTLLLDRDQFPREKACGDAVQAEGFALLREIGLTDPLPDTFFKITHSALVSPSGKRAEFELHSVQGEPCRVVTRYEFDELLYQYALRCGAEAQRAHVQTPIIEDGKVTGVRIKVGKREETYSARLVIGADGATSIIARGLGVRPRAEQDRCVSLRAYVDTEATLDPTIEIAFLHALRPGYAWFFPLSEHRANVGVGLRADAYRKTNRPLRDYLDRYLDTPYIRAMIGEHAIYDMRSWQLPLLSARQQRVFNGALLVGDAGGFVDPLLGAGIAPAMFTGKFAAEIGAAALSEGDVSAKRLSVYDRWCDREFGTTSRIRTVMQRLVNRLPGAVDTMIRLAHLAPEPMQKLVLKG